MRLRISCILLCIVTLLMPFVATAQAPISENVKDPAMLSEIIITATKTGDANLQDVPLAVYAINAEDLGNQRISDFDQLFGSIPGLSFQDQGPGDREIITRGINGIGSHTTGTYFGEYATIGQDAQDGGAKAISFKLFDIERIEVLNGPQGSLYGAQGMAGSVRFIPKSPNTQIYEGFIDTDFSTTDEGGDNTTVSGAVNLPLIEETLALRMVGWRVDNSGWIDQPRGERTINGVQSFNAGLEDINDEETTGVRVSLRYHPTYQTTWDIMYLTQDMDIGGASGYTQKGNAPWPDITPEIQALINANPGSLNTPIPLPGLPTAAPTAPYQNTDVTRSPREDDVDLFGSTFTWELTSGTLTVAASRYEHDLYYSLDSTPILLYFGVPLVAVTSQPQIFELDMFETRFASLLPGPINFLAGVYYQNDTYDFQSLVTATDGNGRALPFDEANVDGNSVFGRFRKDEIEQKAVFGEITYDWETWQLLIGGRYFDSEIESVQATTIAFGPGTVIPPGDIIGTTLNGNAIGRLRQSEDKFSGKVSLSYTPSSEWNFYGLYSEGFRVGGINNANQPFTPGMPETFNSDELANYELGMKYASDSGHLRVNGALFFIQWDDIQVEPRDPAANIPYITNGGSAEVSGLEWAVNALLTEQLKVTFSGTYLFTHELTEDQPVLVDASPAVITGLDGDEIPNIADLQLYGSLQYTTPILGRDLMLIADATYRDSINTEFRTDSPFNLALDSYTIVNLYANYGITKNLTLGAYAKNATNKEAFYDAKATFQDPAAVYSSRPRTVGINANYSF